MNDRDGDRALPQGWTKATLGEVAETKLGKTIDPAERGKNPQLPYLRSANVQWGRIDLADVAEMYFSALERESLALEAGDLLVCEGGEAGRAAIWPGDDSRTVYFQNALHRVRPKDGLVETTWLYHHLRFLDAVGVLAERSRGSTIRHLSQGAVRALPITVPPPPVQRRIVEVLDELDGRCASIASYLAAAGAKLEGLRKAVPEAACSGRLTAAWRDRSDPPSSAIALGQRRRAERERLGDKYVEPQLPDAGTLPDIPEGWSWALLPELGEMGRGRSRHRPRNDPALFGGKFPFVQTGDVARASSRIEHHTQTYNERGLAQSRLWPSDTVCVTIAANIAESALLAYPACFPDSVVGLIADRSLALPEYVELFIRTAREDLAAFAPATAQANINLATLSRVAVPLPSVEEQAEIVQLANSMLKMADRIDAQIDGVSEGLNRATKAVLTKAFRGGLADLLGPGTSLPST